MGTLSYTASVSVDGFAADADGDFQWTAPGDDVFSFHLDRMAQTSTQVMGRRTYELMTYWEQEPEGETWGEQEREFARLWQELSRVVVSSSLTPEELGRPPVRLLRDLEGETLDTLVEEADGEVEIFGPTTAAAALRAGKVHDLRFFIVPRVVGGGLSALPPDVRLDLRLAEQRTFGGGVTYLHYVAR